MSEEKKAYRPNWNVKHNKQIFNPDSKKPLMLTTDEAAPLLVIGAISEANENLASEVSEQT